MGHLKQMRHWPLIRIEYCPLRFPFRASKRLELRAARSPVVVANLSAVLRYARRLPQSEAVIRAAIATEPSVPIHRRQLINVLLVGGRFREALLQLDTALATSDSDVAPNLFSYRAYALAHLGQTRDARRLLRRRRRLLAARPAQPTHSDSSRARERCRSLLWPPARTTLLLGNCDSSPCLPAHLG